MQIAFALVVVFWWIAIWGLSDLLTETWTRDEKLCYYAAMLVIVTAVIIMFPKILSRL
jgi:hypothetical protein